MCCYVTKVTHILDAEIDEYSAKQSASIQLKKAVDSNSTVSLLVAIGQPRRFMSSELIIREGTPGDTLFVLNDGRIRIFTEDATSGNRYVIGQYGKGTLFGEGSLDGGLRTASVEAVGDCECSVVRYDLLRQHIIDSPTFSLGLLTELIKRSRESTRKLKGLALETVYQRFRDMVEKDGLLLDGHRVLGPGVSQQEIAFQLGASRDMLTRILRDLAKGGYVKIGRGEIRVLKSLPSAW
jgi:CRP/FNR family cyclic AMP-dependent transcriptional regulator